MRRPAKTRAQKLHAKQQRALLTLRKAAVKWSRASGEDCDGATDGDALINSLTDMQIAADRYTETLSPREQKRLAK